MEDQFQNLFDARPKIAARRKEHKEERPHSSSGYLVPAELALRMAPLRSPTVPCPPSFAPLQEAEAMPSEDSRRIGGDCDAEAGNNDSSRERPIYFHTENLV